jgi:hypothetical protein
VKTIIAYALLILGLPVLIGGFASTILIMIFRPRTMTNAIFDIIGGIVAGITAFYMFLLLDVQVSLLVPVILSVVTFIWYSVRKERKQSYWNIFGIIIGWTMGD